MRFDARTNSPHYLRLVNLRTEEGQVYEANEFGLSYIYDAGGIRQVMAPTRLLDIVVIHGGKYEVRFYNPQEVSATPNGAGLYVPQAGAEPFETWTVENPD